MSGSTHSPRGPREIGLCTGCGKEGPIFFRQEHRKLCDTCTLRLWVISAEQNPTDQSQKSPNSEKVS